MIHSVSTAFQLPEFQFPRGIFPNYEQHPDFSRNTFHFPHQYADSVEAFRRRRLSYTEFVGAFQGVSMKEWSTTWPPNTTNRPEVMFIPGSEANERNNIEGTPQCKPVAFENSGNNPISQRGECRQDVESDHSPGSSSGSDGIADSTDCKKAFTCPQCKYVTDRKNNLKRHIMTMHLDCDRNLECCNVSFRSKASLREHVNLFHKNGYRCGTCGRNFCRKALLRRHLTVHSGRKDFHCAICDYATSHKSNLERHQKVHSKGPLSLRTTWKFRRLTLLHRPNHVGLCSLDHALKMNKMAQLSEKDQALKCSQSKLGLLPERLAQTHEEARQAEDFEFTENRESEHTQMDNVENEKLSHVDNSDESLVDKNDKTTDSLENVSSTGNTDLNITEQSSPCDILYRYEQNNKNKNNKHLFQGLKSCDVDKVESDDVTKIRGSRRLFLKPYRCAQCGKLFSSQTVLNHHACAKEVGREMFSVVALLSKSYVPKCAPNQYDN